MARLLMIISLLMVATIVLAAGTEPPPSKGGKPLVFSTPEWQPVDDEPLPPGAMLRIGHMRSWHGIEGDLTITKDGKYLIAGFCDHSIRVIETDGGKLVRRFKPLPDRLNHVAVSPDGKTIAVSSAKAIHLYDVDAKEDTPRTLNGHNSEVMDVAFSTDGKQLVSGAFDHLLLIWSVAEGRRIHSITAGDKDHFTNVTFAKGDTAVVACNTDGKVSMWNAENGAHQGDFGNIASSGSLHALPDGKTLAAISWSRGTTLWDLNTGAMRKHLKDYSGYGRFSPNGSMLAVCPISFPATAPIKLYDLKTDKQIGELKGHQGGTYLTAFSPDQKKLLTYGNDHTLRRWDLKARTEIDAPSSHTNRITGIAYIGNGKQLVSCAQDGTVRVWDASTGRELKRLTAQGEYFNSLALSTDGKQLALGGIPAPTRWRWEIDPDRHFCNMRFLDVATLKERDCFYLPGESAQEMQFTPDGREVLVVSHQHVRFHDSKTGKERRPIPDATHGLRAAIVSPDGKRFVTSTDQPALRQVGKISFWTIDTGKEELSRSFMFGTFSSLAFSPDGKFLAVAGGGHRAERGLSLWESPTDKIVRDFATKRQDIYKIAYSPDGRLLAAADPDGISIFEVASAQQRWRFTGGHIEAINSMVFSPDSRTLATAGNDTLIYLWDLTGLHNQKVAPFDLRELDTAWNILADLDCERAAPAIARMAARPQESVPYLKQRLGVLTDVGHKRIEALVADLDSDNFKVRDRATKDLEAYGEAAVPALTRAANHSKSEEVRTKAEQLIKKIGPGNDPVNHGSARRAVRAIEALEHAKTPEALALLKEIERAGKSQLEHAEAQQAVKRLEKK